MQMRLTLANPFLIFLYSLALLVFGCAIGLYWKSNPGMALCLTVVGALLTVIHDVATGLFWFWLIAKAVGKTDHGPP